MGWMSPGKTGRGPDRGSFVRFALFALLTGALTVAIGAQILGTGLKDRYRLTATFDDVTGLLSGDLVKVAGAQVGRVDKIEIRHGRALVTMSVDREVRIPADSTAAVRWRNLVGQRQIYLEPGRSGAMLEPGGNVPHTRSVVDLSEIINSLGPLTRSMDPGQLNQILNAFATALEGNTTNINGMIANMDGLLSTFAQRKQTIAQMTRDYETVSKAVAQRDQQIAQSVDNLTGLTQVFAQNNKLLDDAMVQLSGVTINLDQVLGGNEAQMGRIVDNATALTGTVKLNLNAIEKMLKEMPLTMRQLFSSVNGGHYWRSNALCLNVVQGPCPFPMRFPSNADENTPEGAATSATPEDIAKLVSMLRGGN